MADCIEYITAIEAITSKPIWRLADGPCWCPLARRKAAEDGRKRHTLLCEAIKRAQLLVREEPA